MNSSKKEVIVLGTGGLFDAFYTHIERHYTILKLFDNDKLKHGKVIHNLIVEKPAHVHDANILVVSYYFDEIKMQLISLGYKEESIFHVSDDMQLMNSVKSGLIIKQHIPIAVNQVNRLKKTDKNNILIVMNSLGVGGAEKSLINFVNTIDADKNNVIILAINGGGSWTNKFNKIANVVDIFSNWNDIILQPYFFKNLSFNEIKNLFASLSFDKVIAYSVGFSAKLACEINAKIRIAWIHSDLSVEHPTKFCFNNLSEEVDCYNKYSKLVFVSQSALNGFQRLFSSVRASFFVLGNVFDLEDVNKKASVTIDFQPAIIDKNKMVFLYVGRFSKEKGIDRLLHAYMQAKVKFKNIALICIGDGPLFAQICNDVKSNAADLDIYLLGEMDNPFPYMQVADFLVLPSYYEGQPMVLGEAFILNTPILATKSSGTEEMLKMGEYGMLVDNSISGLFSAICEIASKPELIEHYQKKSMNGLLSIISNLSKVESILNDV